MQQILCFIILAGTLCFVRYRKRQKRPLPERAVKAAILIQCAGLAVSVGDGIVWSRFRGEVQRNDIYEDASVGEWIVSGNGFSERVSLEIAPRELSDEEIEEVFAAAEQEIDETFLGENPDPEHITEDPVLYDSYQDGLVEALWEFDDRDVIRSDGTLLLENVTEETPVQASVTLTCGQQERCYIFSFLVCPPDIASAKGFLTYVQQAVRTAEEATREQETFLLPEQAQGVLLTWKEAEDLRGIQIVFLGTMAGVILILGEREEKRRQFCRIQAEKRRDYPEIVSSLSLYMGAGLSLPVAMGRISEQYLRQKERSPGLRREGFEQMLMTYREMTDGTGEMEALRHFGERNELREYRKLSLLLQQNLKKGSGELLRVLEREEVLSFELRQQLARKAGEEASTRLLAPMMGLLVIVMAVLLLPAMLTMSI